MDITELESYRLSDAVKFNQTLNPELWGQDEKLLPEVREKLLAIADDFTEFLGIDDLAIKDITISGSNAAYTYTEHSDIDLHLVVDLPLADSNEVYRELFDAKKYQYNDQHNFTIKSYQVELYVQNANQPHVSQGIYSIVDNDWVQVPKRQKPTINDISVQSKYEDLAHRVDQAVKSKDLEQLEKLSRKISNMRKTGLADTGEFGPENLAFKVLRNNGTMELLYTARQAAKNHVMSLDERKKKKNRKKTSWGQFGGMWFPGYHNIGQPGDTDTVTSADVGGESVQEQLDVKTLSPEKLAHKHSVPLSRIMQQLIKGVKVELEHTTDKQVAKEIALDHLAEFPDYYDRLARAETNESADTSTIKKFAKYCSQELGIENMPRIRLKKDPEWSQRNATFGRYIPEENTLILSVANRHPMDIMRTLAHELIHHRQYEIEPMPDHAGETGSKWENEANAQAGVLMRGYGEQNPDTFDKKALAEDLDKNSYKEIEFVCANPKFPDATDPELQKQMYSGLQRISGVIPLLQDQSEYSEGQCSLTAIYKDASVRPQILKLAKQLGVQIDLEQPVSDNYVDRAIRGEHYGQQVVAEASGYIPVTDAEAQDPRYSMAVTVDIRPGEPQRQAAKLGWKTTVGGTPPTAKTNGLVESLTRRLQAIKEEQDLEEVAMSPGSLKAFANSPAAAGMQAGFEAELIFSELGEAEEYEPDYEADYTYNPTPGNIEEIIDFFQSGDFADLRNREADRIRNDMLEQCQEWLDERMAEEWAVDQDGAIRDMIASNEPDLSDEELEDRVITALGDQNNDYDSALDAYRDDWFGNYDEGDWLRNAGIRTMSDAASEWDISWPHYIDSNEGHYREGGFSEENAERLADDLAENLGVKTTVSGGYHSAKRDATTWIFEPDSSLEPSSPDDMPVEIVSPPMPLRQALDVMPKFFAWARINGAYANESTGFHMSVSMPKHEGESLDYVKLALFLGDEYVLKQFGREANTYAKSAISKIREKKGSVDTEEILDTMRKRLNQFASNALARPSGFGKYTSINPKTNYIEFRSAGGSDYFADMEKIQNTLMRYARATSLAMDPAADRAEYAKKLYKLLTDVKTQQTVDPKTGSKRTEVVPSADNDAISIFSRYVAGDLPKTELKGFLKQLQYGRKVAKNPPKEKIQWKVTHPNGSSLIKVSASSSEEAIKIAKQEWGDSLRVWPDSAYRAEPAPTPAAPDTQTPQTDQLNSPAPDDPNGNYILRRRQGNEGVGPVLYRFSASSGGEAVEGKRRWIAARGLDPRSVYLNSVDSLSPEELRVISEPARAPIPDVGIDIAQNFPAAGPTGGEFTGQWLIKDAQGREIHRLYGLGNSQGDANLAAVEWLRDNPSQTTDGLEVVPVMR
jgi:hypothetical protein